MTSIGADAFKGCTSLQRIDVKEGNSVYSSQDGILYNAYKTGFLLIPKAIQGEVIIPDGVNLIENYAFSGCSRLTSVTIPNSVTSIGYAAFYRCSGLTSIKVAQGNRFYNSAGNCIIETASRTLILGCKTSMIPNDGSVTSIGSRAFEECSELTEIVIPGSVTSIGDWAFSMCYALTSVTIGDGVTSIGYATFEDCYRLTSVEIPDSVTSIGDWAFSMCYALTSVTIGDGVTSIGDWAFHRCYALMSVTIGRGVTSIGFSAFVDCKNLSNIIYHGTIDAWNKIEKAWMWKGAGDYTVTCTDGTIDKNGNVISN